MSELTSAWKYLRAQGKMDLATDVNLAMERIDVLEGLLLECTRHEEIPSSLWNDIRVALKLDYKSRVSANV